MWIWPQIQILLPEQRLDAVQHRGLMGLRKLRGGYCHTAAVQGEERVIGHGRLRRVQYASRRKQTWRLMRDVCLAVQNNNKDFGEIQNETIRAVLDSGHPAINLFR